MAMSTFQKLTLATCLVLCVALLLPKMLLSRGRKDATERPEGSGHFPPMIHRQAAPEGRGQRSAGSGFSRAHNPEAMARAKGAGTGAGAGGKSNLAGQIIPVYGFGILLYILYILYKITSKGSSKPSEARFPPVRSENLKRKITDFELAQLQEKLRETELVMESIVSSAHHSPDSVKGVTADQEESLLQQLTEITRVMQQGQMVEGIAPEKKMHKDLDDYPDEPPTYWEHSQCCCQHSPKERAETERTEGDKDSSAENLPDDITGSEDADGAEDLSTDSVKELLFTMREEDMIPERDVELREEEDLHEHEGSGVHFDLGVREEDLDGVLEELELTLKVASALEQEKIRDHMQPAETETSCSSVRRRNKRRRVKKAVH